MTKRELTAWILVAFMFGSVTTPIVSAQSESAVTALVNAIDRNTRASIRTCEAVYAHRRIRSGSTVASSETEPDDWQMSARCWR